MKSQDHPVQSSRTGFHNVFWKRRDVNILSFAGYIPSVTAAQSAVVAWKHLFWNRWALSSNENVLKDIEIWMSYKFYVTEFFPFFSQTLKNVKKNILSSQVIRKEAEGQMQPQDHSLLILLIFPRWGIYKSCQPQEGALGFALRIQSKNLRLGLYKCPQLTKLVQGTLYSTDLLKNCEAKARELIPSIYLPMLVTLLFHEWLQRY